MPLCLPKLSRRALACAVALIVGCSTDPLEPRLGCDSEAPRLSVSAGLSPTITWTGGCPVAEVVVSSSSDGLPYGGYATWAVRTDPDRTGLPNNLIDSGVHYGVAPSHTQVHVGPEPLIQGQRYVVEIYWTSESGAGHPGAYVAFTP